MPEWSEILQAQKNASMVLVLFVPSVDRYEKAIEAEGLAEGGVGVRSSCSGTGTCARLRRDP
jgi:uncharacterized 2Fe-2S/4Fe-4S cluster protein (DUF4445 family)